MSIRHGHEEVKKFAGYNHLLCNKMLSSMKRIPPVIYPVHVTCSVFLQKEGYRQIGSALMIVKSVIVYSSDMQQEKEKGWKMINIRAETDVSDNETIKEHQTANAAMLKRKGPTEVPHRAIKLAVGSE